ncbi:hypothetical protein [Staphylococcus warneri]|uniref:hypothetical protein n=1 Tax=Staphylococcus warneri TaxID=1292 RepID=UPI00103B5AF5|nr:hypothetical protein [Staphylococcus warneri]MDK4265626.1 hypothetical protein [Staphylococcus warneri]TBW79718.1 hypothetical protein EQ810_10745 [Staphylococcus warneri]
MAKVYSICVKCQELFDSGVSINESKHILIFNHSAGKCPKCGNDLIVADGFYSVFNEVMEISSIDGGNGLQKLKSILEKHRNDNNLEKIEGSIKNEIPKYKGFISLLKKVVAGGVSISIAISAVSQGVSDAITAYEKVEEFSESHFDKNNNDSKDCE